MEGKRARVATGVGAGGKAGFRWREGMGYGMS
jgi:hypothetical protein